MRERRLLLATLVLTLAMVVPAAAAPPDDHGLKMRVFVHYPNPGRPQPEGVCDPSTTNPSTFGLTGWRLSGTVTYRVNYGSIPSSVVDGRTAIANSFGAWNAAGAFKFAEGAPTTVRGYKYDGQNVVVWGNVPGGAIAVTYTWYYADGTVAETDTVMGKSLPWKYTSVSNPDAVCGPLNAYDVQDILTHEVGHWVGLDDLYAAADHDLTMYGYGSLGELKKDTLAAGDLAGVKAIYK